MRSIPSPSTVALIATLILAVASAQAYAQTDTAGKPVAPTHLADEAMPTTVPDGGGGAFIGFRAGPLFDHEQATFVAHVDASGDQIPGWHIAAIGQLYVFGTAPVIVAAVDPGRAWIAPDRYYYEDIIHDTPFVARPVGTVGLTAPDSSVAANRNHFRNSLTVLPTGRILLASKSGNQLLVAFIEPDGGVTEGSGTITVPANFSLSFDDGPPAISDGGDGAWVLCELYLNDENIAVVRVAADGSPLTVRTVCDAFRDQTDGAMAADGSGGVFIAWSDARDLSKSLDVYAAHLLPDGTRAPGWGIQGNPIASVAGDQFQPQVVSDASGGAWLVWIDSRSGVNDIYFTHLGADGTPKAGFPAGGRPLCAASGSQIAPRIVADGEGGFYAVWSDGRGGGLDLYAQHIHSTGDVMAGWVEDGVAVCTEGSDQTSPALVLTSPHHALATWTDRRTGYRKVYAAALPPDGAVAGATLLPPTTLSMWAPRDPARGAIELLVSSAEAGEIRVSLHDVTGRVVGDRVLQGPANAVTIRFAADGLGPGLYFARAARAGTTTSTRISLVR